jgi:hypothetical protein
VDATVAISPDTLVSMGPMSIFDGRGTAGNRDGFYRDTYSRGSMQTKAMRSASSEDIRSVARRAMRTREGKGRQRGFVLLIRRRYQRTFGSLVQVGAISSDFA